MKLNTKKEKIIKRNYLKYKLSTKNINKKLIRIRLIYIKSHIFKEKLESNLFCIDI